MIFIKNALVVIFVILGVVFLLLCLYTFLEEYMAPPKRSYKFKIEYDEKAKRFILLQKRRLIGWHTYKDTFKTKEDTEYYMYQIVRRYAEEDEMKRQEQFYDINPIKDSSRLIENKSNYNYHPKTKEELKDLIKKLIEERGNKADLNDVDVSQIKDMSELFYKSQFNGDISNWNVSKVENMSIMFFDSKFNGDISNWNVSSVEDMGGMFEGSKFNGNISKWDVSRVKNMRFMFYDSEFNGDISNWNVSKVEDMYCMFQSSKFNGDISKWDVSGVKDMSGMFSDSKFNGDISNWTKKPE